jgi:hypothetical protein
MGVSGRGVSGMGVLGSSGKSWLTFILLRKTNLDKKS